jgi:hypothetical protein
MRAGGLIQLLGRLRQADVQAALAAARPLQQELQGDCGLAGAGVALQQVQAIAREAAAEHVVEAGDTEPRLV